MIEQHFCISDVANIEEEPFLKEYHQFGLLNTQENKNVKSILFKDCCSMNL